MRNFTVSPLPRPLLTLFMDSAVSLHDVAFGWGMSFPCDLTYC